MAYRREEESEKLAEKLEDGRYCWERWDDEPGKEWFAFQSFRDAGPRRTIEDTGRYLAEVRFVELHKRWQRRNALCGKEVPPDLTPEQLTEMMGKDKRPPLIARLWAWARIWHWAERAVFFDRYMDQRRVKATESEIHEMVKRHVAVAGMLQNKAVKRLREMDDSALSPKNVLDFLTEGIKLERLSREQATSNLKVNGEPVPESANNAKEILRNRLKQIGRQVEESQRRMAQAAEDDEPQRS